MFLDERLVALGHRTPREAARDPALRPKLIHLMKQRVRSLDERNLQAGRTEEQRHHRIAARTETRRNYS